MVLWLESVRSLGACCREWDAEDAARRAAETDDDGEANFQPPGERENRRINNPPQQLAEVVPGGAQDRVNPVACSTGQIVAIQSITAFQVSNRGLNGRAAF